MAGANKIRPATRSGASKYACNATMHPAECLPTSQFILVWVKYNMTSNPEPTLNLIFYDRTCGYLPVTWHMQSEV
jgi:hypothetical protein